MSNYSALILAAGIGKRMKSDRPKVLAEICGKPLLAHIIAAVEASGISRIGIVTGYKGETVREQIGGGYDYYDQPSSSVRHMRSSALLIS
jgi:bifunctional UDP-N-acetylglucosamine pyrophosphorylase/glucosamine-1-phosphate N-acetyltransferase